MNNCPQCHTGVLESVGYIELKPGPLQLQIGSFIPDQTPALNIRICSKDHCGYVHVEAAPASLSLAKRNIRDILFQKTGNCR